MATISNIVPLATNTLATTASPFARNSPAEILNTQLGMNGPQPSKLKLITNGLAIPPSMAFRLRSFPEEIYSLQPSDNLVKFLKVLIGAAGAGESRARATQARLSQFLQGASFYELDAFYGNIFGVTRLSVEDLPLNPYTDLGTYDDWSLIAAIDATYRSRIDQFARAVSLGPSPVGIQLVAEAILQMKCSVYESWLAADNPSNTVANVQTLGTPVSVLAGYTNLALQTGLPGSGLAVNRRTFTIIPYQSITQEQQFALQQIIDQLKPVGALAIIQTEGFEAYEPITLRGVAADSSYWQVVESVIPNPRFASAYSLSSSPDSNGYFEVLRPPSSEYQGEEIIYNPDIIGAVAYNEDSSGHALPNTDIGTYTFLNGVTISYPATKALASRFHNLSGRLVSDGILQGSTTPPSVALIPPSGRFHTRGTIRPVTLYADGMAVQELVDIIQSPGAKTFLGDRAGREHYWATPSRFSTDPTIEVLEVRLKANRLLNSFKFELAHFPQNAQLQYFDSQNNTWNTIWSITIPDSIPSVFLSTPSLSHSNPQHDAPNHWDSMSLDLDSITTDRVRLVLARVPSRNAPVTQTIPLGTIGGSSIANSPAAYSLGVQNLILGYVIDEESDLPTSPIFTSDAFGSQVEWTTRQELATNAISGRPIPWRSSPQPSTTSVVNFYADTRDATGKGQLINEFYIDPLYINSSCGLYFSNDDTADLGFAADATNLIPPVAINHGTLIPSIYGMEWPASDLASITIENQAIQFDPAQPWWCGVVFNPNYGSNQIVASSPTINQMLPPTIWDFGNGLNLSLQPGTGFDALVTLACDSLTSSKSITFGSNDTVYIVVAYLPNGSDEFESGLYLFATTNLTEAEELSRNIGGILVQPIVHPIFDSMNTQSDIQTYLSPTTMGPMQPTTLSIGESIPDNLIPDPLLMNALSAVNPSWNSTGIEGTANGDFDVLNAGTWVYYGTGSASGYVFPTSQIINVTPGAIYTISGFIDATHVSSLTPYIAIFDTTVTSSYVVVNQSPGVSGQVSAQWTVPPGVTQVVFLVDTANCTVIAGAKLTWSQLQFTQTSTVQGGPSPANMNLISMVLKQEVATAKEIDIYGSDYSDYTQINPFVGIDPTGHTTNALLRFNPIFIQGNNISGFIGGPGYIYPLLSWTPLARDFVVSKGFMQLNPTLAKYWKFEFTNLTAQAINTFIPIKGSINTHQGLTPSFVQTPHIPALGNPGAGPPGVSTALSLATNPQFLRFSDQTFANPNNLPNPNIAPPTATQIAPDIITQLLLAETNSVWQFQEWHANPNGATRFVRTGVHDYHTTEMNQNSQIGFFAGLNSLQAYKLDFTKTYDSEIYDTYFYDETNISFNSWDQNPCDLNTFGLSSFPVTAISVVMYSTTPVSSVQFATSQNDAIQLAYDDDFQSGATLSINWTSVLADKDTSMVNLIGDARIRYDLDTFSIDVYRNSYQPPAVITDFSPINRSRIVAPVVHPIFDERYLTPTDIIIQSLYSGGIATSWCSPAAEGNVWGAVRVTADRFLDQPLQLQIIDAGSSPSFTPTVLATKEFTPAPGQTVEETIGYTLGTVMSTGNPIYVQIVQTGNVSENKWTVHRLSFFDEGIIWQFSNNGGTNWHTAFGIRGNALGILTFPTPGNALMWKAIGTRPNVHVSGLRIRPVYTTDLTTIPQGILQGPNLSMYDHCPPILEDPLFNGWSNPVPYWWFANNQDYPLLGISGIPNVNAFSKFYVREAIDTISSGSDTVTRRILHVRDEDESLGIGDEGSRTLYLNRPTSETITVSDSAVAVKIHKPGDTPMVRPDTAPVGDGG